MALMDDEAHQEDPGANLLWSLEPKYLDPIGIFVFLIVIGILLLLLNSSPLHKLTRMFPESCMLILLGVAIAAAANAMQTFTTLSEKIDSDIFFLVLLPPIILDSSYDMYSKHLVFNFDGILLMAILGTALNAFAIGASLYGTFGYLNDLSLLSCLMLGSILAAVDPVAVLAIFNEVGVQKALYMLIFGESLLNDGVTVVLFDTLSKIAFLDELAPSTYGYAFLSFVPIALGGALIGILYGITSSVLVRLATARVRILEPSIILLFAYMSYLNACLFHWSGIISLISCGLVQKRYGFQNIGDRSRVTIENGTKLMASLSETIIFLILGFKVLDQTVIWDYKLILWSLLWCTVYRFVFCYLIGWSINTYRLHRLTSKQLFFISYGGLRGAVAFAMAASIEEENVKDQFMGATLGIILFTVFVQGSSVRFLVNLLNFREDAHKETFTSVTVKQMNFHVLAGMETILGGGGSTIHYWLEKLEMLDKKYLHPLLCTKKTEEYGFAEMLHAEARGGNGVNQNHMMWGALIYAQEKLASKRSSRHKPHDKQTRKEKKKAILKLKSAIHEQGNVEISEHDENLNLAWKRKLELIRTLKAAVSDNISTTTSEGVTEVNDEQREDKK